MMVALKYFKTKIHHKETYVELVSYPNHQYIVYFINDKANYTKWFDSSGFGVRAFPNHDVQYFVYGDMTDEIAKQIWKDIQTRLETPDEIKEIPNFNLIL